MNRLHRWYCASDRWARDLEKLVPWVVGRADLGANALEIGPGPGLTTDLLRARLPRLTALEIDPDLAAGLAARLRGTNVRVMQGDATAMPFPDATFTGAASITMLHHVPSPALQDRLLAETFRVLATGAVFVGADTRMGPLFWLAHRFDTMVPVDPAAFGARLERAGFTDVAVDARKGYFRFRARRL